MSNCVWPQLDQHSNVLRRRMIIKSDTYTSLLGESDAKNIVEKSFFLQKFCKNKNVLLQCFIKLNVSTDHIPVGTPYRNIQKEKQMAVYRKTSKSVSRVSICCCYRYSNQWNSYDVLPNLEECTPLSVDLNFHLTDFGVTIISCETKRRRSSRTYWPSSN